MIFKYSIVKYKNQFYRVSRINKNTVNLRPVFGGKKVAHKSIPKSEVVEARDEWHEHWSKSETYRCM
jgi:hypothetical protein